MGRFKNSKNKSKSSKRKSNAKSRQPTATANKSFASAEVIDVVLNDEHPSYNPAAFINIGAVKARQLKAEFGVPDDTLQWHNPLFGTGLWITPLIGEIVLLVAAAGKKSQTDNKVTELYYLPPINIWQDPNHNQLPGSSFMINSGTETDETSEAEDCNPSGQYSANPGTARSELPVIPLGKIFDEKTVQKLFPYEGDILSEGRSGHSIRFGSTVKNTEYPNWWSTTGENGDPIIIISDGHSPTGGEFTIGETTYDNPYKIEDPNNDSAVVILTHSQTIPIEISSTIGNNIRQDSYGNSPSNKKQDATKLDYKKRVDDKEANNEPIEVNDRDQDVLEDETSCPECPDGSIPEKDSGGVCLPCEKEKESNSDDEEITDVVIGGYMAHEVAGRQGLGWSEDTPQGSYGTSKPSAQPREVETACKNYPGDLTGLNVILSSGLENFFHSVIIHVNEMLPAYKLTKLKYDGTFSRSIQPKDIFDKLTQDLVIDRTKNKDFDIDNPLDYSDWNTSQPLSNMTAQFTKTLQDYATAGGDNREGNSILIAMDILKERGATSIKLLGVGDYWLNTHGYADRNLFLQEQADKIDICTFVGGFEQKKSGHVRGGEPADMEAYREQINGQGVPPITTPPPTAKKKSGYELYYEKVDTYKGFHIWQSLDAVETYKGDTWDEPADYHFRLQRSFEADPGLNGIEDKEGFLSSALESGGGMSYQLSSNIRTGQSVPHIEAGKTFPRKDPFSEGGYLFAIKKAIDEEIEDWIETESI